MEPKLKYDIAYVVDCHDLDKFVAMHLEGFGVEWRALDSSRYGGFHNGSYEEARVSVGAEIEDDLDQDFSSWLTGGSYYQDEDAGGVMNGVIPGVREMLQWLCNMGKVPEGKYVVELWW